MVLQVNGVTIATPSKFQQDIYDISDSYRNVNGDLIFQKIATKYKLNMVWNGLTESEMSTLLSAVSATKITVTYQNFVTNSTVTGNFYVGDRTMPIALIRNGNIIFENLSMNFIEM